MTEAAAKLTDIKVMAIVSFLIFGSLGSMANLKQQSTSSIEAYAQQSQTFIANLNGKNEVPPVDMQETGTAQFFLAFDGKEINYNITITNPNGLIPTTNRNFLIEDIMTAYIHKGKSGESGLPVAELQNNNFTMTSRDNPRARKDYIIRSPRAIIG